MKMLQRMLIIFIITIFAIVIIPNTKSLADVYTGDSIGEAIGINLGAFNEGAKDQVALLNGVVGKILGFLQIASAVMAVIILAYTGFRYVVETPDMKSELKKTMIPIIVGVLIVFGATTIAKFIVNLVGG